MTNEEVRQAVLAQIQLTISPANFTTWFKSTNIVSVKEGGVVISVSNSFVKEWLEQKYQKQILKILHTIDKDIREITFLVKKDVSRVQKDPIAINAKSEKSIEGVGQLGFEEFKINKESNLNPKYSFDNFIVGPYNELAHAAS
ncbi:MAG: hypothetical protein NTX14_00300, partial [Candidatus Nealsonbacteria bacterium]|nr:hypothetical protein [Candidatus Nealsonbacteria bacterium]